MPNKNFIPQIIWEKWVDPFGENIEETKWNNYDEDEDDDIYAQQDAFKNKGKPIRVIASPLGLIPYNEYTSSAKIFNFWVGHTNFNLSEEIIDLIETCEGVEILDVFTRYRFRIGIGKCFIDSDVMQKIRDACNEYYSPS
jgi:hypothetical protein